MYGIVCFARKMVKSNKSCEFRALFILVGSELNGPQGHKWDINTPLHGIEKMTCPTVLFDTVKLNQCRTSLHQDALKVACGKNLKTEYKRLFDFNRRYLCLFVGIKMYRPVGCNERLV